MAAFRCQLLSLQEVEIVFLSILDRDDLGLSDDLVSQVLERLRN